MTVLEEIRNGSDNVLRTHMAHFAIVCMMGLLDMPRFMTEMMLEAHPGKDGKFEFLSTLVIPALSSYLEKDGKVTDIEKKALEKIGESQPEHVGYTEEQCGRDK